MKKQQSHNCLSRIFVKKCNKMKRLFCCIKLPKYLKFPCCRRREELLLATESNTQVFSFKGMCFRGKILKLEKDRLFSLALMFPDAIYKIKCKLYGFENIQELITTESFKQNITINKHVFVVCHDFTDNGLLQVTLYEDRDKYAYHDISINEILLIQSQAISNKEDLEKLSEIDLGED